MANAKPSRPGADTQIAGKMETNILKDEKIVKLPDGRVVKRAAYDSGTVRETEVFHEDHMDAPDFVDEVAIAAEEKLRAEIRAEVLAEIEADSKSSKTPAKPAKGKGGE